MKAQVSSIALAAAALALAGCTTAMARQEANGAPVATHAEVAAAAPMETAQGSSAAAPTASACLV